VEATFLGGEYVGYDFRESGGEPIVSTLDEVSFLFKTRPGHRHDGLLFYSGECCHGNLFFPSLQKEQQLIPPH
jgi:hypothetical protein